MYCPSRSQCEGNRQICHSRLSQCAVISPGLYTYTYTCVTYMCITYRCRIHVYHIYIYVTNIRLSSISRCAVILPCLIYIEIKNYVIVTHTQIYGSMYILSYDTHVCICIRICVSHIYVLHIDVTYRCHICVCHIYICMYPIYPYLPSPSAL